MAPKGVQPCAPFAPCLSAKTACSPGGSRANQGTAPRSLAAPLLVAFGAVGMMAWRQSRLLRLRVDVLDQPIKMGLERFTAFLRPVTPNVHRGWDHAEITRKLTF